MTVEWKAASPLPTRFGEFRAHVFVDARGNEHVALVAGHPENNCLVRLHSECATGDLFGSLRCDCRDQLEAAMQMIAQAGQGILIYLRGHEGRGIGLANKIRAYGLQDQGMDTVDANLALGFPSDSRDYAAAVDILNYFDVNSIRLLTNNRHKITTLEQAGITIAVRVPMWLADNPHNVRYLQTKQKRMGHIGR